MALVENGEKTLRELGLTSSQARVYLALVRMSNHSTVKAISIVSKVARQDIYRTLTELRDLSLVELVVGNPALFRAIPIQEALTILVEREKQKQHALLAEAQQLVGFLAKEREVKAEQADYRFVLVPKREVLLHRTKKLLDESHTNISVVASWRELTQSLFNLHDSWQQALNRGVKVRWIIEKRDEMNGFSDILEGLLGNSNFSLKTDPSAFNVRFSVYDNKEVFVGVSTALDSVDSSALWTNNPVIVYILKDYFQTKWKLIADNKNAQPQKNLAKFAGPYESEPELIE